MKELLEIMKINGLLEKAMRMAYIKFENFRTENFRQKTSDKKLSEGFSGISDKKTFEQI